MCIRSCRIAEHQKGQPAAACTTRGLVHRRHAREPPSLPSKQTMSAKGSHSTLHCPRKSGSSLAVVDTPPARMVCRGRIDQNWIRWLPAEAGNLSLCEAGAAINRKFRDELRKSTRFAMASPTECDVSVRKSWTPPFRSQATGPPKRKTFRTNADRIHRVSSPKNASRCLIPLRPQIRCPWYK